MALYKFCIVLLLYCTYADSMALPAFARHTPLMLSAGHAAVD